MASQRYQSPSTPMVRSHSDPVTSDLRRKVEATQCHVSPEVVYVMTDDAVGKFLQLMFLWMEKSNTRKYSDAVSGAPDDNDNLISKLT